MAFFSRLFPRAGKQILSGQRPTLPVRPMRKGGPVKEVDSNPMATVIGKYHDGGVVKKDGAYELEKGEKVIPAPKKKGRMSDYRSVYLKRKKSNGS